MSDRHDDGRTRAYVVELIAASPLPPPFPSEADEAAGPPARPETRRGVAVAAGTFAVIVGLAIGGWWLASLGRQTGLGTSGVASDSVAANIVAVEAAVVAEDGTVLRGRLWRGDDLGIIVAPGYGDDADDARQVAESLARSGHTVFFYNLRGQSPSGGVIGGSELTSDLRSVVADMRTRGIERIYVVGYRQSATAAIVLAAEPSGVAGVTAVFAYGSYENLDAMTAAAESTAPILFIGAEGRGGEAAAAGALASANGKSAPYILSERPPASLSSDHFSPKIVQAVLQFVSS